MLCVSTQATILLQTLNDRHSEELKKLLSRNNQPAEDAAFISIDRLGTDVRVRHGNDYSVERLGFDFVSPATHFNLFCELFLACAKF